MLVCRNLANPIKSIEMDFSEKLKNIQHRIENQSSSLLTEEAVKHSLVLPMLSAWGYDVFNPEEVTPELIADIGTKKGEKIDYAILLGGKPVILIECKGPESKLSLENASQLYRYFSVTEVRFAVLTNGIQYKFYTDLDAPNKMDSIPFLEIDLRKLRESDIEEIEKFSKSHFNIESILGAASELKYVRALKQGLSDLFRHPSEEFVKMMVKPLLTGPLTQKRLDQFTLFVRKATNEYIKDVLGDGLKNVLNRTVNNAVPTEEVIETVDEVSQTEDAPTIETTVEELHAFYIVKAILSNRIKIDRITLRDRQTYCGVLLDDNNRKPIIRFHFNGRKKQIELFENNGTPSSQKVTIETIEEIFTYQASIHKMVDFYEGSVEPQQVDAKAFADGEES